MEVLELSKLRSCCGDAPLTDGAKQNQLLTSYNRPLQASSFKITGLFVVYLDVARS